jgi:hypothetical protein
MAPTAVYIREVHVVNDFLRDGSCSLSTGRMDLIVITK